MTELGSRSGAGGVTTEWAWERLAGSLGWGVQWGWACRGKVKRPGENVAVRSGSLQFG